jgi:hypothetical protein
MNIKLHIHSLYHKCIFNTSQLQYNKQAKTLLNVKCREVSGWKDGLLHVRAFTIS